MLREVAEDQSPSGEDDASALLRGDLQPAKATVAGRRSERVLEMADARYTDADGKSAHHRSRVPTEVPSSDPHSQEADEYEVGGDHRGGDWSRGYRNTHYQASQHHTGHEEHVPLNARLGGHYDVGHGHAYGPPANSAAANYKTRVLIWCITGLFFFFLALLVVVVVLKSPNNLDGAQLPHTTSSNEPYASFGRGGWGRYPCVTPTCTVAAGIALMTINETEDPCNDPYEWACGHWLKTFDLPPDYAAWTKSFTSVYKENQHMLKDLLESGQCSSSGTTTSPSHSPSPSGGGKTSTTVIKAKSAAATHYATDGWDGMLHCYYQACMDTDKLDSLGAAPLLNFLSKQPELGFLLLWPGEIEADEGMVRGREGEGQGLSVRMAHLHRWGVEGVLTAGVTYNNLHPSHNNTLGVAQGGLGLSYSHYFQPDILAAYTRHLATLFRLFFEALPSAHNASLPSPFSLPTQQPPAASLIDTTNDTYATIDERVRRGEDSASEVNYTRVAEGVVEFERQLHGIHLSPEQQRDPWNTTFSSNLSAIQEWMPVFDWNAYYKVFADKDDLSLSDEELAEAFTPDAEVLIQSRPHLTKLNALLHKYLSDRRKRPTLHYYFLARTLRAYGGSLSAEWRKEFHSFRKILTGSDPPPRWRTCLSATADAVGWILSRNFIRHHFNPLRKTLALEIMSGIREAFRENLAEIEWMDKDTKQKALDKESEITAKVGYPDWLLSKDEHLYFARFYGNPQPAKLKSLLSGTAHLNKQSHRFSYSKLHRPEDRSLWGMTPIDVNAYYSPDLNEIVFPASILQPPFLNVGNENSDTARRNEIRALRAVNYGALGAVIGHELTHAFDDSGSSFDGQGKLVSWWSQTSKDKFRASTHCVASQYGSFAIPGGIHLNGNLTLGENIADNGGLRLAYRALLKAEGEEALSHRPLPGLPYTAQQLFFLSFAQLWCSKQTPETLRRRVENDPHSPGEFRVKGSLDNFEPFDEAFCQAKTHAMLKGKQPHRCRVW